MPTVNVKLFAGLQGLVGRPIVEVSVPAGATVGTLRDRMVEDYPQLEGFMSTLVYAIGEEMVPPEHVLTDGERIELIPPISGG
jgi:molybdopterin converting factor small subunit